MAQPPAYIPVHSFVSDSATLANFPGQALDVEFQDVKTVTDAIRANLALIQRDDGHLQNTSVDWDQLSTAVKASIGDTTSANAILAAATAATAAASSATASQASATASASSATTSASNAATSATNAATSASNAAATLANAVTGQASSVDGEVMLYSGTTGKASKRASTTGILKAASGVLAAAVAGTDYLAPAAIGVTVQAFDAQLFSNIPQNSVSGATYTLVATDAQKHILHPTAEASVRTVTIPANASVAFPIGTVVTFVNQNAAGVLTISITTDTMRLAGPGTTGSRTLAANGIATAIKLTSTEWIISGTGLT